MSHYLRNIELCLILLLCISSCKKPLNSNSSSDEHPVSSGLDSANVWPQFRGINGSGVAQADQKPPFDLESAEKLIWKTPLISGASSPCIWGNRIFLTGFDLDQQQLQVMCYDRIDGKLMWIKDVPANEIESYHKSASPADATPVADGERIYVHFGSYGLLCYDFEGNVIWMKELPVNSDIFGSGTSPILTENLVIHTVRRIANNERYLLALNKMNGEQVWKKDLLEAGYGTPVIWGNEVVVHGEGFIAGYSIKDGSRIWYILIRTGGESSPTVNGDVLYVNSWHWLEHPNYPREVPTLNEFFDKYDSNSDSRISRQEFPEELLPSDESGDENTENTGDLEEVWSWFDTDKDDFMNNPELHRYFNFCIAIDHGIIAVKSGGKGNITTSHVMWRESENIAEVPSPIYYKDRVYVIKEGGFFSCVDASDGTLLYKTRIKGTGPYFASPVAANGKIYLSAHNGKITVLQAGDEFKILTTNTFNEKILASPAIVDNKIYIRTDKHLYAFGE